MLLSDVLCYAFLTVTITTSYAQADSSSNEYDLSDEPERKQVVRRDTPLIIDHFPYRPILKHRPKFIYKRVSNPKYRSPKPAYGVTRTKQRSAKPSRKVMRKYRKSVNPKYSPPSHYKRPPKIRYANPRTQDFKPLYGILKRSPDFSFTPKPAGFGEPPNDYYVEKRSKMNYADSPEVYRGSIKVVPDVPKFSRQKFSDPIDIDEHDYLEQKAKKKEPIFFSDFDGNFASSEKRPLNQIRGPEYEINQNAKTNYGDLPDFHTRQVNKMPKIQKPTRQKLSDPIDLDEVDYSDHKSKLIDTIYLNDFDENFGTPEKSRPKVRSPDYGVPLGIDDDENIFSDVHNSEKTLKMAMFNKRNKQKRAERFRVKSKPVKKSLIRDETEDDVIGGRYAEPPNRYNGGYNPRRMLADGGNIALPGAVDPNVALSATMSPYVNYKHSNLAFSPQNLNDAFSIVN